MSTNQNPGYFSLYRGWNTTQLYGDYFISQLVKIPMNQPGFNGMSLMGFDRCSGGFWCFFSFFGGTPGFGVSIDNINHHPSSIMRLNRAARHPGLVKYASRIESV